MFGYYFLVIQKKHKGLGLGLGLKLGLGLGSFLHRI